MLGRAAVLTVEAAAGIVAETVFIDQEESDIDTFCGCPLFNQCAFAAQVLFFIVIKPGLMTDPDIEIRRVALADRRGAAHGIDTGNRQFAAGIARQTLSVLTGKLRQPV